jgi:CRP-like cAMP-binding protein
MNSGALGKTYHDGEVIFKQGDVGNCMYIIQSGQVEVLKEIDGRKVRLAVRGEGDFFGEMALFESEARMATVRALGTAKILTIDKKNFLRRVHQDPSMAYHLIKEMSARIRQLSETVTRLEKILTDSDN